MSTPSEKEIKNISIKMTWALSEKIVNGIKHEARQQKIKKIYTLQWKSIIITIESVQNVCKLDLMELYVNS